MQRDINVLLASMKHHLYSKLVKLDKNSDEARRTRVQCLQLVRYFREVK